MKFESEYPLHPTGHFTCKEGEWPEFHPMSAEPATGAGADAFLAELRALIEARGKATILDQGGDPGNLTKALALLPPTRPEMKHGE